MTIDSLISFFRRLLILGAGEGDTAAPPAGEGAPAAEAKPAATEKKKDDAPIERGDFFERAEEGEEPDTDHRNPALVKGTTDGGDPDADDPDEADADAEAESAAEDTEAAGDGGDEGDDPAVMALIESWNSRADVATATQKPASESFDEGEDFIPDEKLRAKFRELINAEDDLGAMTLMMNAVRRHERKSYHQKHVKPVLDEYSASTRENAILRRNAEFVQNFPGAFSEPGRQTKMIALYEQFKTKGGVRFADEIPVESYYRMAGGRMKRGAKAAKPTSGTATARAEADKKRALGDTQHPAGTGKAETPTRKKRDPESAIMAETEKHIRRNSTPAFIIRG